jgi:multiple sugar transport system permease protein
VATSGQTQAVAGTRTKRATRSGGEKGYFRSQKFIPYLFLAPYLILFGIFVIYPAVSAFWISFHEWDYLLPNKPWVGLQNFTDLFTSNSLTGAQFWEGMRATAQFTLYSVPPLVILPLLVAVVLNQKFAGRNFFRAIYFAPYVLGVAVVGIVWRYLLDPNVGPVNYYLGKLGISDNIPWTNGLPWAWIALVGMTVWWTLGFNTVIYIAGLQGVNRDLYDAARVDGANTWQVFRNVTLPSLRPVIVFVTTVTILASANMFGQSWITTQGAPGNSTRTAIGFIYEEGIRNFRMGKAAAMSIILALFLAIVGAANFWFFGRKAND